MSDIIGQAVRRLDSLRRSGAVHQQIDAKPVGEGRDANATALNGLHGAVTQPQSVIRRSAENGEAARRFDLSSAAEFSIDESKGIEDGLLLAQYDDNSPVAQQYRSIKWALLNYCRSQASSAKPKDRIVVVTSANSGEGKTHIATNLAISLSREIGGSCLLIDCDISRPAIGIKLGIAKNAGLIELLENDSLNPNQFILKDKEGKLLVLPAGLSKANYGEYLASSRMHEFLQSVVETLPNCFVVIDSPPLLPSSEGKIVASLGGQIVVVARAHSTLRADFARAMTLLNQDLPIWPVLNDSKFERSANYGYAMTAAE